MPINSNNPFLNKSIPDYYITIFFTGLLFIVHWIIITHVSSMKEYIQGFFYPLSFAIYYFWIKAIALDVVRIQKKEYLAPGAIYFAYIFNWVILWMIFDLSRKFSSSIYASSPLTDLYFTNTTLFWIILEVITSMALFPLRSVWNKSGTTRDFLIADSFRMYILFTVFIVIFVLSSSLKLGGLLNK